METFSKYLVEFYAIERRQRGAGITSHGVQAQLEACVWNLLTEVPLPPPGHTDVLISVGMVSETYVETCNATVACGLGRDHQPALTAVCAHDSARSL